MEAKVHEPKNQKESLTILMAAALESQGYKVQALDAEGFTAPEESQGRVRNHRPAGLLEAPKGRKVYLEVVLCDAEKNRDDLVSRLQLFSSVAVHEEAEFHLALPRDGNEDPNDSNEKMIRRILDFHELPVNKVWVIGVD